MMTPVPLNCTRESATSERGRVEQCADEDLTVLRAQHDQLPLLKHSRRRLHEGTDHEVGERPALNVGRPLQEPLLVWCDAGFQALDPSAA